MDNDVGAATGTGDGDIMMRFLPAFQAVNYMREGMPPTLACEKALVPIALKFPAFKGALVCVSKDGRHGAAAHGWVFHYSFQDPSLAEPQVVEALRGLRALRQVTDLPQRLGSGHHVDVHGRTLRQAPLRHSGLAHPHNEEPP